MAHRRLLATMLASIVAAAQHMHVIKCSVVDIVNMRRLGPLSTLSVCCILEIFFHQDDCVRSSIIFCLSLCLQPPDQLFKKLLYKLRGLPLRVVLLCMWEYTTEDYLCKKWCGSVNIWCRCTADFGHASSIGKVISTYNYCFVERNLAGVSILCSIQTDTDALQYWPQKIHLNCSTLQDSLPTQTKTSTLPVRENT